MKTVVDRQSEFRTKASSWVSENSRVQSIFDNAIKIDDESQRERYIETACGDPELLLSVRQLLQSFRSSGSFLDSNAFGITKESEEDAIGSEILGSQLGPYTVIEFVGEGSFGHVFKARQEAPLNRSVAIKLVKPGLCLKEVVARFDVERQSLAMMNHPGIAKIFSADHTADGRPYFAMEFVDGISITEYARHHQCSLTERLELMADVCDALQHAHEKDIVHRDIKPSNILVYDLNGRRRVKLIDFGVSKILSPNSQSGQTLAGQMLGTPRYMSPEQQACRHGEIDFRSDIFSLGVVLFELLTGFTPQPGSSGGLSKPSKCIDNDSNKLTGLDVASEKLRKMLAPGVDWVVQKAIASSPEDRYSTAATVGRDIRKYLVGEIVAQKPSFGSTFAKQHFSRIVGVCGLLTCCLLVVFVSVTRTPPETAQTPNPADGRLLEAKNRELEEIQKLEEIADQQANELRKIKFQSQAKKVGKLLKEQRFEQGWLLCEKVLDSAKQCDDQELLSSDIYVFAGRLQNSLRNYRRAIGYFERAYLLAEKYSTESGVRILFHRKSELLAMKGKAYRSSPKKLEGVRDELFALIEVSEKQNEINPFDLNTCRVHLVGVQTLLRDEGVVGTLEGIYETQRQFPASISPQKALQLQLNAACVYFTFDNDEPLVELLKSILKKHDEFVKCKINPFLQLANFCSKQNLHDKCRLRLTDILNEFESDDLSDSVREIHCGLGLLEIQRSPKVAASHLEKAISQKPHATFEFFALPMLAKIYVQMPDFQKARAVVHRIGRHLENSEDESGAVEALLRMHSLPKRKDDKAVLAIESGKVLTAHLLAHEPDSWTTYAHLIELGKVFHFVGNLGDAKDCFENGFVGLRKTVDSMPTAAHSLLDVCLTQLDEISNKEGDSGAHKEWLAHRSWWSTYKQQIKKRGRKNAG